MFQFGVPKKSIGLKNGPSIMDSEVSRMRQRNLIQDREKLFNDVMQQKMTANFLKDENLKLRTRVQIMEQELNKKDRYIDDLISQ